MITNRLPVEGGSWKPYEALAWRVLGYENRRAIIGMVCVEVVGHRFESVSPKAEREFRERVNVRRTKYNLGFP